MNKFLLIFSLLAVMLGGCGGNKYLLERDKYRASFDPEALAVPPGLNAKAFGDVMKITASREIDQLELDAPMAQAWLRIASAAESGGLKVESFDRQAGLIVLSRDEEIMSLILKSDDETTVVGVKDSGQMGKDLLLKELNQLINFRKQAKSSKKDRDSDTVE